MNYSRFLQLSVVCIHMNILDEQNYGILKSYYIIVHSSVTGVFLFHINVVFRQISFLAKR